MVYHSSISFWRYITGNYNDEKSIIADYHMIIKFEPNFVLKNRCLVKTRFYGYFKSKENLNYSPFFNQLTMIEKIKFILEGELNFH